MYGSSWNFLFHASADSLVVILIYFKVDDPGIAEDVRKAGDGIRKAFRKVSLVAMPGPGSRVLGGAETDAKKPDAKFNNLRVSSEC